MALTGLNASCTVFGIRSSETPKYTILESEGDKEIRSYPSYVVAQTTVTGEFKDAQGDAFRILAGYIFGKNQKKQKLDMTTPVRQEKAMESEKISMTAPVMQSQSPSGLVMSFMMPSKYSMSDLPTPLDERVVLKEVPATTFAVIRYSGLGSQSTNTEKASELKDWLIAQKKYQVTSEPSFAGYDPPWTLPFLRRNEMMFEIKAQ
jgi:hypothetical protein